MIGQAPRKDRIPGTYKALPVGLELYDLATDIGETKNLAAEQPEKVKELQAKADAYRTQFGDTLTKTASTEVRPAAR